MRVSTGMIFQRGLEAMQRQQSNLLDTQQHIAANKRVMKPSDDPVAASRAVETSQAKALNAQYGANQAAARDALGLAESTLGNIGDVLQDARVLLLNAGSGTLADQDRQSIALELQAKLSQLIGLANSRDGAGGYLFSGYQEQAQPFTPTQTGAAYNGDQGQRELQVDSGRSITISENGVELFERIRQGNGTFVTASAATNAGTGVISTGRTTGAVTAPIGYRLDFHVDAAGVTTYDVIDTTQVPEAIVGAPGTYVSGAAIVIGDMQVEISGAPADGDQFSLAPAQNQSVFSMLNEAVAVLNTPPSDGAARARYTEGVERSLTNIDRALDRVLTVRTSMGASLRELDSLGNAVQDNALHYNEQLSELLDLDYAAALTQFAREQTALEAAQLSYQRMSTLSLFNYL
ncbi:MAG TPA: flagellar hook-associated protein FlgL [Burkholderiales bacterium]